MLRSTACLAFVLSTAATAAAADPAKAEPEAPAPDAAAPKGQRGLELMLRPGYGAAGDVSPVQYDPKPLVVFANPPGTGDVYAGTAKPYGGGFAGDVSVGYRFLPFMSAGIYAELRSSSAESVNDGTSDLSRSGWGSGMYVRGYFPMVHPSLDPWVSVGVGYAQDTQTYKRAGIDWELKHHGVAVPLGLGIDYRVAPMFAIGPSFRYAFVSGAGGCLKLSTTVSGLGSASNKQCTDADEFRRITKAESYGAWSVGLDLRLTLGG